MLIVFRRDAAIKKVIHALSERFSAKNLCVADKFIGVELIDNPHDGTRALSQMSSIESALKIFNLADCKLAGSPMDRKVFYLLPKRADQACNKPYLEEVINLLHFATSPSSKIAFPVGFLAQLLEAPTIIHWKIFMQIFFFLQGTKKGSSVLKL